MNSRKKETKRKTLCKPRNLKKGDKVAIVSLSSGMLGEDFCSHNIEIGTKRLRAMGLTPVFMPNALKGIDYLKKHPEARAADLKAAFADDSIAGIICAIGGDDTYRLLPYLMEDDEFVSLVKQKPKLFTGFSDTTVNHLMFYKLGLSTFYGPSYLTDVAEIGPTMLPYTEQAFLGYFDKEGRKEIVSSPVWYNERKDFSAAAIGTERICHEEKRGFELLQGSREFSGRLLGGCLESMYDILGSGRYEDERQVCERYGLFPEAEEWEGRVLFIETCEEKPEPELVRKELNALKKKGVFGDGNGRSGVNGIIVGKPQDEQFYEEYKQIYREVIENPDLPILYNVNFGHANPRCVLPYGALVRVDVQEKKIIIEEPWFVCDNH